MILEIDFSSEVPIYLQIRNQIVQGIANGKLALGQKLPTIRNLADELGVNMMTANKAYQLLKQEGYVLTDRRNGAMVNTQLPSNKVSLENIYNEFALIVSEARLNGMTKAEILKLCERICEEMGDLK